MSIFESYCVYSASEAAAFISSSVTCFWKLLIYDFCSAVLTPQRCRVGFLRVDQKHAIISIENILSTVSVWLHESDQKKVRRLLVFMNLRGSGLNFYLSWSSASSSCLLKGSGGGCGCDLIRSAENNHDDDDDDDGGASTWELHPLCFSLQAEVERSDLGRTGPSWSWEASTRSFQVRQRKVLVPFRWSLVHRDKQVEHLEWGLLDLEVLVSEWGLFFFRSKVNRDWSYAGVWDGNDPSSVLGNPNRPQYEWPIKESMEVLARRSSRVQKAQPEKLTAGGGRGGGRPLMGGPDDDDDGGERMMIKMKIWWMTMRMIKKNNDHDYDRNDDDCF